MAARTFPFVTQDVFFSALHAKRQSVVPTEYTVNIAINIQVGLRTDQIVEVTLELSTGEEDQVVNFSATVKGLFRPQDGFVFPGVDEMKPIIDEFVTERAVGILWGYADLTIRHMLTSLGVNVVKILPETNASNMLGPSTPLVAPPAPAA